MSGSFYNQPLLLWGHSTSRLSSFDLYVHSSSFKFFYLVSSTYCRAVMEELANMAALGYEWQICGEPAKDDVMPCLNSLCYKLCSFEQSLSAVRKTPLRVERAGEVNLLSGLWPASHSLLYERGFTLNELQTLLDKWTVICFFSLVMFFLYYGLKFHFFKWTLVLESHQLNA